jgi:hypothetical protein
MRAGLFWLNDRQWARLRPNLPSASTGAERDDEGRVIIGVIHMLQLVARRRVGAEGIARHLGYS